MVPPAPTVGFCRSISLNVSPGNAQSELSVTASHEPSWASPAPVWVHPPPGLHESAVQGFLSLQSGCTPARQTLLTQASTPSQASPLLHSASVMHWTHVLSPGLHTGCDGSEQSSLTTHSVHEPVTGLHAGKPGFVQSLSPRHSTQRSPASSHSWSAGHAPPCLHSPPVQTSAPSQNRSLAHSASVGHYTPVLLPTSH